MQNINLEKLDMKFSFNFGQFGEKRNIEVSFNEERALKFDMART